MEGVVMTEPFSPSTIPYPMWVINGYKEREQDKRVPVREDLALGYDLGTFSIDLLSLWNVANINYPVMANRHLPES